MSYVCKREKNKIKLFKTSFAHKLMRFHVDYIFFNNGFNEKNDFLLIECLILIISYLYVKANNHLLKLYHGSSGSHFCRLS